MMHVEDYNVSFEFKIPYQKIPKALQGIGNNKIAVLLIANCKMYGSNGLGWLKDETYKKNLVCSNAIGVPFLSAFQENDILVNCLQKLN